VFGVYVCVHFCVCVGVYGRCGCRRGLRLVFVFSVPSVGLCDCFLRMSFVLVFCSVWAALLLSSIGLVFVEGLPTVQLGFVCWGLG